MTTRISRLAAVAFALNLFSQVSYAQGVIEREMKMLPAINEYAKQQCMIYPTLGEGAEKKWKANADAGLYALVRSVIKVGLAAGGGVEGNNYVGVLREDLPNVMRQATDCRERVAARIESILFRPQSAAVVNKAPAACASFVGTWRRENSAETMTLTQDGACLLRGDLNRSDVLPNSHLFRMAAAGGHAIGYVNRVVQGCTSVMGIEFELLSSKDEMVRSVVAYGCSLDYPRQNPEKSTWQRVRRAA